MAVITLKVSEEEKLFLQSMAKFEGKSLSELIREKTLSSLEDEYDAKIADMKLEEYEKYLASGGEVLNWDEL
jgi:toxin-antitoxin system, antitoxin component, ribbon-helix-helix fold